MEHLSSMSRDCDAFWDPHTEDPRRLHNSYVMALEAAYLTKYSDLSESILAALDREDYLTYALCGRALIEIVATLRYYVRHQYGPLIGGLLDKGAMSPDDQQALLKIDDRHLRGSRFDWESFVSRRFSKMKEHVVGQLQARSGKGQQKRAELTHGITAQQVNVFTCVEKWAEESSAVLIAYNLFCEMVHPNIGSNFLVCSADSGKLYFTKHRGEAMGRCIFEQTFPILLSVTQKPFSEFLPLLLATCWQEDELK